MTKRKTYKENLKGLTFAALLAALYVALSYICKAMGLLDGAIQLRFPEALCVLCSFTPYAVPGMALGCLLTNILTAAAPLDIIIGPIATLIGALFGRLIAKRTKKDLFGFLLVTLPTVLSNALLMPPVIMYSYGAKMALPLVFLTVGIGEFLSASVMGAALGTALKKVNLRI